MIGIYKITNLINNKSYIGQSVKIEERWNEHKIDSFNKNADTYNSLFYKAIRKYGLENFKFEVLEECLQEQLNEREKYWITHYHTWVGDDKCQGYNLTTGGEGVGLKLIKLNQNEIDEIVDLILNSSLSFKEIALKFKVTSSYIRSLNKGRYRNNPLLKYPLRETNYRKPKEDCYCIECGVKVYKNSLRCKKCSLKIVNKNNTKSKPSREELFSDLYCLKHLGKVANKYKISTMLLSEWCKSYNINTHYKNYIKQYELEHASIA